MEIVVKKKKKLLKKKGNEKQIFNIFEFEAFEYNTEAQR